ncbi:MAG: hypothetical protein KJ063_19925 [Anaerolineae bacterium]|nr:hypothetical protein [Anaerolineae bacterium]
MSEQLGTIFATSVQNQSEANALLEKLVATARPEAVYSLPVTQGEFTVITASELYTSLGFGFGHGGGGGTAPAESETAGQEGYGGGGGGGGGGVAAARPVAAIIITPKRVQVEPIVDVTKISLAFFTTFGAMLLMLRNMKKK